MSGKPRGLGILAGTLGQWDTAAGHFEDALELNERMGTRLWVAHGHFDFALMLLERARPGDRERASELLSTAGASANELEMTGLADKVSTAMRAAVAD